MFDPIAVFNQACAEVSSHFEFDRAWRVIGKADMRGDDGAPEDDPEIYSGRVVTPQGFAALLYHEKTGTLSLATSKSAANLRGVRQKDGRILADAGMAKAYIIHSRKSDRTGANFRLNSLAMRAPLHRYCTTMGERNHKHSTLFGASTKLFDGRNTHEIYTNGRLAYSLDPAQKKHEIVFHAPVRRENGSFVPVRLGSRGLSSWAWTPEMGITKVISKNRTYEESRHDLAYHWQAVSSRLWDQKSLHAGEGTVMAVKRMAAGFPDYIMRQKASVIASGAMGAYAAMESHQFGLVTGLLVAGHVVAHLAIEGGVEETASAGRMLKEARRRQNIDMYPSNDDVSDHFKIKTRENIAKLCPHIDLKQFPPEEFEIIQAHECYLLPDNEKPEDGLRPVSLRGHLLSAHQRGFSSTCMIPDSSSALNIFQSGLLRFMNARPDGNILIYAGDREDACTLPDMRLPENFRKRFRDAQGGNTFVRILYDPRKEFTRSFSENEHVGFEAMMQEISSEVLFKNQAGLSRDVKERSLRAIAQAFRVPEPQSARPGLFMSGQPPAPPDIHAAITCESCL